MEKESLREQQGLILKASDDLKQQLAAANKKVALLESERAHAQRLIGSYGTKETHDYEKEYCPANP